MSNRDTAWSVGQPSRITVGRSLWAITQRQTIGSGVWRFWALVQRDLRDVCVISTSNIPVSFRLPGRSFHATATSFARITSVAHYFPPLDPRLLSVLLDSGQDSPCII